MLIIHLEILNNKNYTILNNDQSIRHFTQRFNNNITAKANYISTHNGAIYYVDHSYLNSQ